MSVNVKLINGTQVPAADVSRVMSCLEYPQTLDSIQVLPALMKIIKDGNFKTNDFRLLTELEYRGLWKNGNFCPNVEKILRCAMILVHEGEDANTWDIVNPINGTLSRTVRNWSKSV